jgi:hypothetical protein
MKPEWNRTWKSRPVPSTRSILSLAQSGVRTCDHRTYTNGELVRIGDRSMRLSDELARARRRAWATQDLHGSLSWVVLLVAIEAHMLQALHIPG